MRGSLQIGNGDWPPLGSQTLNGIKGWCALFFLIVVSNGVMFAQLFK